MLMVIFVDDLIEYLGNTFFVRNVWPIVTGCGYPSKHLRVPVAGERVVRNDEVAFVVFTSRHHFGHGARLHHSELPGVTHVVVDTHRHVIHFVVARIACNFHAAKISFGHREIQRPVQRSAQVFPSGCMF